MDPAANVRETDVQNLPRGLLCIIQNARTLLITNVPCSNNYSTVFPIGLRCESRISSKYKSFTRINISAIIQNENSSAEKHSRPDTFILQPLRESTANRLNPIPQVHRPARRRFYRRIKTAQRFESSKSIFSAQRRPAASVHLIPAAPSVSTSIFVGWRT